MKTKVCKSCGYVGSPIHDEYSSFVLDLFAWVLWFAIGAICAIFPLMLIGPLFTLFHLSVFRTKKCPKCGNLDMVNIQSHTGQHIMNPHEGEPQPWTYKTSSPAH